jgi:hypothetical protein
MKQKGEIAMKASKGRKVVGLTDEDAKAFNNAEDERVENIVSQFLKESLYRHENREHLR